MLTQEKLTDPSLSFMQTMMSLYFTDEVTAYSGRNEVEALPPMEALVLGMMCLEKTYNSRHFDNRLRFKYRSFSTRECGIFTEVGILGLVARGYPSKQCPRLRASQALSWQRFSRRRCPVPQPDPGHPDRYVDRMN